MNVGILSWIIDRKRKGVDNYIYNLIKNMIKMGKSDQISLIHYKKTNDPIYSKVNDIIIPKMPLKLTNPIGIPRAVKNAHIDILHLPIHWYTQISPFFLNRKVKKVLTIHDLTPILFPEMHTRDTVRTWNSTLNLIKNRTDSIISDSLNTKNDCIELLNIPEERIKVIPLAADEIYKPMENKEMIKEYLKKRYNVDIPFILFVGTLEKRKNVPLLIKAFNEFKGYGSNHKLVIVGGKGWKYTEIFDLIKSFKLKDDVIFTDYVPDNDLVKFYNIADLFVYPSLYEGFGLPPLEAMACGCPVITSNISSLPEVVGDAGLMIDPNDVESLTESMHEILTNEGLKENYIKKSLERAKMFSWKKTAEETWKTYEETYKI
ncbi:MAG: glycosyltransferase family 1 protein [Methanobacterium sp.]